MNSRCCEWIFDVFLRPNCHRMRFKALYGAFTLEQAYISMGCKTRRILAVFCAFRFSMTLPCGPVFRFVQCHFQIDSCCLQRLFYCRKAHKSFKNDSLHSLFCLEAWLEESSISKAVLLHSVFGDILT